VLQGEDEAFISTGCWPVGAVPWAPARAARESVATDSSASILFMAFLLIEIA
jgi:hypothetical protein